MLSIPISPFLRYNPKLPRRAVDPREISLSTNAEIENGSVTKSTGWEEISGVALDGPARHISEHITNTGTRFICIMTLASFFVYDTSTGTAYDLTRTGDAYGGSYQWSSCSYGNMFIFTNGVDEVQSWDGNTANPAADLNSMVMRPQHVMTFESHLILACDNAAVDTAERKAVYWSVPGDPTDFGSGGSGTLYAYEGKGSIKGIATLTRDSIAIYKTDSIHLMEYVGSPMYFVARSALLGVGIDAQNAIVSVGNDHIVLTNSGLQKYNGSSITQFAPEINPILEQYYPNNNSKYATLLHHWYSNKLWVFLAKSGSEWPFSIALVYSFREQSWSVQSGFECYGVCVANTSLAVGTRWVDMPVAWNTSQVTGMFWGSNTTSSRLRLIMGGITTKIYQQDSNSIIRQGSTYQSTFETMLLCPGFILFQQPTVNTELVQLDVGINSGNPNIYIGVSNRGDETITWHGAYTPDSDGIVWATIVGRWFVFRVEDTQPFSISSLTPWFVKRGVV